MGSRTRVREERLMSAVAVRPALAEEATPERPTVQPLPG